jgi:hypothetical protein
MLRFRQPSVVDLYLDATAWIIAGVTLSVVIARAVFAPGRVTLHRVIGAVLLYLNIGFTFVALFCFIALLEPNAFAGMRPLQDNLSVAADIGQCGAHVRFRGQSGHDRLRESAFAVAIGAKADMPFCTAYVRL